MKLELRNIGLDLAVIGSAISIVGVLVNNVFLLHVLAMQIWVFSNLIFCICFYGRTKDYWDGGLSDKVMFWMYVVMFLSGILGLMQ